MENMQEEGVKLWLKDEVSEVLLHANSISIEGLPPCLSHWTSEVTLSRFQISA